MFALGDSSLKVDLTALGGKIPEQSPNCYSSKYLINVKDLLVCAAPKQSTVWTGFNFIIFQCLFS